jgi:large subunit ribosomal protein L25
MAKKKEKKVTDGERSRTAKTTKKKAAASSKRPELKVEKRKVVGRKVKNLRKDGVLPAAVYGREIKSVNLQADGHTVQEMLGQAGETTLIDLNIKGEKSKRPVLMKNPQYDPVTDKLIHLDFHQVDLTQTVTAEVPVELAGKSPAAESGEGVLVQLVNEIEVEALPTELPEKFIVDISGLKGIDDAVTVADLEKFSDKVELKVDKERILAKVEPLEEEIEEPAPLEEEVVEEAVEGEEAPPVEGEEPVEEKKVEEKAEEKPQEEQKG